MTDKRKHDGKKAREIAKEYVDTQLKTMRANGLETENVSKEEYEALVDDVASAAQTLIHPARNLVGKRRLA